MSLAPDLLRLARRRAGVSQAELARRAGMPRSVLNAYERGSRDPGAAALDRLLEAAGVSLVVSSSRRVDPARADRILQQVLDLAEALPARRRAAALGGPSFRVRT